MKYEVSHPTWGKTKGNRIVKKMTLEDELPPDPFRAFEWCRPRGGVRSRDMDDARSTAESRLMSPSRDFNFAG